MEKEFLGLEYFGQGLAKLMDDGVSVTYVEGNHDFHLSKMLKKRFLVNGIKYFFTQMECFK